MPGSCLTGTVSVSMGNGSPGSNAHPTTVCASPIQVRCGWLPESHAGSKSQRSVKCTVPSNRTPPELAMALPSTCAVQPAMLPLAMAEPWAATGRDASPPPPRGNDRRESRLLTLWVMMAVSEFLVGLFHRCRHGGPAEEIELDVHGPQVIWTQLQRRAFHPAVVVDTLAVHGVVDEPGSHVQQQLVAPVSQDVVLAEEAARRLDVALHQGSRRAVARGPLQGQHPDWSNRTAGAAAITRAVAGQRRRLAFGVLGERPFRGHTIMVRAASRRRQGPKGQT